MILPFSNSYFIYLDVTIKNYTICDSTVITLTNTNFTNSYGIITSPMYPQWEQNKNCDRKIVAPIGKILRVYLNDFKIEPVDDNGK